MHIVPYFSCSPCKLTVLHLSVLLFTGKMAIRRDLQEENSPVSPGTRLSRTLSEADNIDLDSWVILISVEEVTVAAPEGLRDQTSTPDVEVMTESSRQRSQATVSIRLNTAVPHRQSPRQRLTARQPIRDLQDPIRAGLSVIARGRKLLASRTRKVCTIDASL